MGKFPGITHPSAARQQSSKYFLLPLDLHVLGLPPAFNLSHDQTLQLKFWLNPKVQLNEFCLCMLRELLSLMFSTSHKRRRNKSLSTSSTTVNVHTDLLVCLIVKERFGSSFRSEEAAYFTHSHFSVKNFFKFFFALLSSLASK